MAHLAKKEDRKGGWSVNGAVASALAKLKAVEAAPVMEAAFKANVVDEFMGGDWPQTRYEMGLGPRPAEARSRRWTMFGERMPKRPDPSKLKAQQKAARKPPKRGRR